MIERLKQYIQERRFGKLKEEFDFPTEFIEGIETSETRNDIYKSLCQYTKRLQHKGVSKITIQGMLDSVSKYIVRRFGKQEWRGGYAFDRAMPLFYGLAERPEHHDTPGDLERVIGQFDFVAELNGIF